MYLSFICNPFEYYLYFVFNLFWLFSHVHCFQRCLLDNSLLFYTSYFSTQIHFYFFSETCNPSRKHTLVNIPENSLNMPEMSLSALAPKSNTLGTSGKLSLIVRTNAAADAPL